MRDPEQIAASIDAYFDHPGPGILVPLAAADLLREGAEALRSLARQNRDDVMALGEACEIEAERDALIAYVRFRFRDGARQDTEYAYLPESVRQKIEGVNTEV